MLNIDCDICKQPLVDFGALLFSPPELDKEKTFNCKKFHICKICYKEKIEILCQKK